MHIPFNNAAKNVNTNPSMTERIMALIKILSELVNFSSEPINHEVVLPTTIVIHGTIGDKSIYS